MSVLDIPHTIDAFHRGRFRLIQPSAKGHRSGVDAMVLASVVPNEFSGRIADLGAGAGAAGLAVLSRCGKASATLIERSELMAQCARLSLALPENHLFSGRCDIVQADVTAMGKTRMAAGIHDNFFDFAIMNSAFQRGKGPRNAGCFESGSSCHDRWHAGTWIKTAASIVKPGGSIAIIARPASMLDLLTALQRRFGGLIIVPVQPRPQEAAIRIIIKGVKGSRAGLTFHPPLVMHHETGNDFTERAIAINNGVASLF